MNFEAFNNSHKVKDFLPTKKLKEVALGDYKVTKLKLVNTPYGKKVVAELNDEFAIFVTKRVNQAFLNNIKIMFNIISPEVEAGNVTLRYMGGKYYDTDFLGP